MEKEAGAAIFWNKVFEKDSYKKVDKEEEYFEWEQLLPTEHIVATYSGKDEWRINIPQKDLYNIFITWKKNIKKL